MSSKTVSPQRFDPFAIERKLQEAGLAPSRKQTSFASNSNSSGISNASGMSNVSGISKMSGISTASTLVDTSATHPIPEIKKKKWTDAGTTSYVFSAVSKFVKSVSCIAENPDGAKPKSFEQSSVFADTHQPLPERIPDFDTITILESEPFDYEPSTPITQTTSIYLPITSPELCHTRTGFQPESSSTLREINLDIDKQATNLIRPVHVLDLPKLTIETDRAPARSHLRGQSEPLITPVSITTPAAPTIDTETEARKLIEAAVEFFNVTPKHSKSLQQTAILRAWENGREVRWEGWKNRHVELLRISELKRRRRHAFIQYLSVHPWLNDDVEPILTNPMPAPSVLNHAALPRHKLLTRLRTWKDDSTEDVDTARREAATVLTTKIKRSLSDSHTVMRPKFAGLRRCSSTSVRMGPASLDVVDGVDVWEGAQIETLRSLVDGLDGRKVDVSRKKVKREEVVDDESANRHANFEGNRNSGILDPPAQVGYWDKYWAEDVLSTEREKVREMLTVSMNRLKNDGAAPAPEMPRVETLVRRLSARKEHLDIEDEE
ncbi:hypothetical protein HK096_002747 [Nowakowskiella sp. JEL0078]|nr:hypothetical protein HK096_002747 [Nowakowskiella sp. JEL0078]